MSATPESSPPPRGLARDIDRIKTGGAATAAELREFIGQLRGKRPQEMLGLIAGSSLVQCTCLSAMATAALIAVFTVGPYAWNKLYPSAAKSADATPAPATATAQSEPPAADGKTATSTAAAKSETPANPNAAKTSKGSAPLDPLEPSVANKQKALEKLGIGETKTADPKKNPLDNSADDLLKDIK